MSITLNLQARGGRRGGGQKATARGRPASSPLVHEAPRRMFGLCHAIPLRLSSSWSCTRRPAGGGKGWRAPLARLQPSLPHAATKCSMRLAAPWPRSLPPPLTSPRCGLPEVCQPGHPLLVVTRNVAAGCVVHKRLAPPHQPVEEGALAHVRPANNSHLMGPCVSTGVEGPVLGGGRCKRAGGRQVSSCGRLATVASLPLAEDCRAGRRYNSVHSKARGLASCLAGGAPRPLPAARAPYALQRT